MDKAHRIAGSLAATAAGVLAQQIRGDMVKIDLSVRNAEGVINTKAIREVPIGMPPDAPGILIAPHMPAGFTKSFAERLNKSCELAVNEERGRRRRADLAWTRVSGTRQPSF